MRRSTLFAAVVGCSLLGGLALALHAVVSHAAADREQAERRQLVRTLGLTDLCLFTDARYTRNPSQSDLHTAFQDYPLAFEHFPSGTLLLPPPHLRSHGLD